MFDDLDPRHVAAVGLLALVPTVVYGFGHPGTAGFVAAINVVIVFASLYVAMSPLEDAGHADDGTTT